MAKDLTNSRLDRQNILNNKIAVAEIQEKSDIKGIIFEDKICLTKNMVAQYFEIEMRTVERYVSDNISELTANGYEILKGKRLKEFIKNITSEDVPDINVGNISSRTPQLAIFDFRAFLNMAMLLSESEKARALRQLMLDIVIDLINKKTGGSTKYINQRDQNFLGSSLQEENYRRQFTDVLRDCVVDNRYKYAKFTDMIYVSIFKEKAKEYKKILDLKANDKIRDTFYSEILDIIAAYESGLADEIRSEYEKVGHKLSFNEVEDLFRKFENMALWKPLIQRGRTKMASRDMALREAFHSQLVEYIQPLEQEEYEKFLGAAGDELERLMQENQDVLRRLKERD